MIDLLRNRRSIRKFTEDPLSDRDRAIIEEALLRSPTSRGINHWEFFCTADRDLLLQLSKAKPGAGLIANAPFAIVIAGDESKSDVWIEDASIAAIICQLTAESLSLGSCWVQIRNRNYRTDIFSEAYIRTILGLTDTLRIDCIIAIGHPAEHPTPHPESYLQHSKIHTVP